MSIKPAMVHSSSCGEIVRLSQASILHSTQVSNVRIAAGHPQCSSSPFWSAKSRERSDGAGESAKLMLSVRSFLKLTDVSPRRNHVVTDGKVASPNRRVSVCLRSCLLRSFPN